MACPHGFDPANCMICQTLGPPSTTTRRATRRAQRHEPGSPAPVEVVAPSGVDRRGGGGRLALHVLTLVGILVLAGLSFWLVTSVLFAVLRLLEIVVVAAVAGGLGYRVGRARGRRER